MRTPNLFDYATSEISQDAIIAKFFRLHGISSPTPINQIKVIMQDKILIFHALLTTNILLLLNIKLAAKNIAINLFASKIYQGFISLIN
jgi:hypothetical protein